MNPDEPASRSEAMPKANVVPRRRFPIVWLVPLLALGFVAWLAVRHFAERGPTITIRFNEATGLEAGKSEVQFRGAIIGQVSDIRLTDDLKAVVVEVELHDSAERVASAGSEFWIVQPEVTIERIRGLGAIVSGNYIEVKPGSGERKLRFTGLDQAPVLPYDSEGLQLALLAPELSAITRGSAVIYRGVSVGRVTSYEMETNSKAVRINVHIDRGYAPLVRSNTKFWNAGGLDVNFGWRGLEIGAESFKTLVAGGIAFATPDDPGEPAKDGALFRLYGKPEDNWKEWAPAILISPKPRTVLEPPTLPSER